MIEIVLNDASIIANCGMSSDELMEIIKRTAHKALEYCGVNASATILLTDNEEIRSINRNYRGIDAATDVLSFPAVGEGEGDGAENGKIPGSVKDAFLGDIAISVPKALEQSREYGHSFSREIAFLTAHGMLHILGYDHETGDDEAEMFTIQKQILSEMGLSR